MKACILAHAFEAIFKDNSIVTEIRNRLKIQIVGYNKSQAQRLWF